MKNIACSLFVLLVLSCGIRAESLREKYPDFYDWAYPKRIEDVLYSKAFDKDLKPVPFDLNDTKERRDAYLKTIKVLDWEKRVLVLKATPLDTAVRYETFKDEGAESVPAFKSGLRGWECCDIKCF